ncbi:EXS family-domain-containing protein [Tribonema minus]|uniref:EXS family-domain-containing protein n=1 Tax=Tribonema minus TaxID=303371 RepID=A0A835ZE89_9STRA|nr:EXS family-domain-containing protein [Tribonema minus]
MVQFGLKLQDNIVAKWADHYMDYKKLKTELTRRYKAWEAAALADAKQNKLRLLAASLGVKSPGKLEAKASPGRGRSPKRGNSGGVEEEESFKSLIIAEIDKVEALIIAEIDKVEAFYVRTRDSLGKELDMLLVGELSGPFRMRRPTLGSSDSEQLESMRGFSEDYYDGNSMSRATGSFRMKKSHIFASQHCVTPQLQAASRETSAADALESDSLQRAMSEIYRDLTLLRNFAIINYTAAVKLLKKHDKKLAKPKGPRKRTTSTSSLHSMGMSFRGLQPQAPKNTDAAILAAALKPSDAITADVMAYLHRQDFYALKRLTQEKQFHSDFYTLKRLDEDFYTLKRLDEVTRMCEKEFAIMFCSGNVSQARGMLLPQKTDERFDWAQFQLGYHLGIAAVLAFWVVWDCCVEVFKRGEDVSVMGQPAFRVYRGVAGLLLLHWAWGFSVLVWTRTRINFIYLFELDPRHQMTWCINFIYLFELDPRHQPKCINFIYLFELDPRHQAPPISIFNDAALETVVFLANLLAYYKAQMGLPTRSFVPPGIYPLVLCLYTAKRLIYPMDVKMEVDFFATYCADVLTSSVKTVLDMAWTIGFFLSGDFLMDRHVWMARHKSNSWEQQFWYVSVLVPALCVLPLWLRFQQCLRRYHDTGKRFPNLANALKYAMAQTVSIFGVFRPPAPTIDVYNGIWMALYIVSSLYSFWWDIKQDWGLGHRKHGWLSERRMHSRVWVYWATIAVDLILRFNWLYSFIPPGTSHFFIVPNYVTTVVIMLEIFRRTLWGFFRLENEHLRNTEGYRTIDVVPLHFHTAKTITEKKSKGGAWVLGEVFLVAASAIVVTVAAVVVARNHD